ncbi:MAG: ferredoxin [Acidobacteria bacterium]|nr:ferredoxin [Acidobacteriota bacterium]
MQTLIREKRRRRLQVLIEPGSCWGKNVAEDSGTGACQTCVEICPEVFEKPAPDRCARTRPGVNPRLYARLVFRAAQWCPVNAIRVTSREEAQD